MVLISNHFGNITNDVIQNRASIYASAVLRVVILSSICLSVSLSVCPSVTRMLCDKTK